MQASSLMVINSPNLFIELNFMLQDPGGKEGKRNSKCFRP